ncbi:hypothetical protein Cagg_0186 [Chloroflexus aggregans DSM 9485]|uniref:Uncharacterized protein n=1 Tax=Chloroflexus aggregans (strain MD-66 / DSM 9485) TaxID=326427 RepID=B8GCT7_CHLAD|nr:hypothetical protein Cagg_0186 [Chloroflexus aggregans DSM 9485]
MLDWELARYARNDKGAVRPWNDEHCTVMSSAASHPPRVLTSTVLSWRAQRAILSVSWRAQRAILPVSWRAQRAILSVSWRAQRDIASLVTVNGARRMARFLAPLEMTRGCIVVLDWELARYARNDKGGCWTVERRALYCPGERSEPSSPCPGEHCTVMSSAARHPYPRPGERSEPSLAWSR